MARKPNFTEQIADRIAEKAAERVLDVTGELAGGPASESTTQKLTEAEDDHAADFDLFDYCEDYQTREADDITYNLYKGGGLLCSHSHPWSWREIQEEFGGGMYRCQAKSLKRNKYFKQQSMRLHTPVGFTPRNQTVMANETPSFSFSSEAAPAAPVQQGPSLAELMAVLQQQQQQQQQQARESRESMMATMSEIGKTFAPVLAALLAPRMSQREDGNNFEMIKFMMETLRESQRQNQDHMRMMFDELKKSQVPAASQNPYEILAKMRADEEGLLERAIKLQDILNDKASELADLRMSNNDGEEKEEDTLKLVLKALLPVAGAIGQQIVASKTAPVEAPVQPVSSPASSPASSVVPMRRPSEQVQAASPVPVVTTPKPTIKPSAVISLSKPAASVAVSQPVNPNQPQKSEIPVKEKIVRNVVPYLQKVLMKMTMGVVTPTADAARETLSILGKIGITQDILLKEFSLDDLFVVVKSYKLPETVYPWFNKYYADLSSPTTMEVRERA